MFKKIAEFIRSLYPEKEFIPLHEPKFIGNEKKYVNEAIDSTFVSSVGEFVNRIEKMISDITGSLYSVATVNGTSALHIALKVAGVKPGDEVITQPLTFVATVNAISYCGGFPVFIDVNKETMGLCPDALLSFLEKNAVMTDKGCINQKTGHKIAACLPMHTFGHPCKIDLISDVCKRYHIKIVEDAAESIGTLYHGQHTGTFGDLGIYSFNGNKTVTCGGGGAILTRDENAAKEARHLTTTAKTPHPYEFVHDKIGYNYRMPNLNAALGCAQLEKLEFFLENKRQLASLYQDFFKSMDIPFFYEPENARSNFWLNAVILNDRKMRNDFLETMNGLKIMTRPIWRLIHKLDMYRSCQHDGLKNAQWLEDRIVNIPSSVRL